MLKHTLIIAILLAGAACSAQQEQPPAHPGESKPQVKINYINVCTPGKDDQEVINGALGAIPVKPAFSADFEIARGHTTMKDAPDSKFVRLRRDFAPESPLMTAQYSMSTDSTNTIEILVLRMRDPKEFHEIAIEDRVSAGAAIPAAVLSVDTPATRIRIERLGKSTAGLSRCPETDQSAYDAVFRHASEIMAQYRVALGLRTMFKSEIAWLNPALKNTGAAHKKTAAKKP
ncbi:MAG TPA: hypothetical protein VE133_02310 [Candidatus Sulfotelmatobacter sp.]|nr:hypothetical protein [Candidatus Sulfotelmatobacter sp.]